MAEWRTSKDPAALHLVLHACVLQPNRADGGQWQWLEEDLKGFSERAVVVGLDWMSRSSWRVESSQTSAVELKNFRGLRAGGADANVSRVTIHHQGDLEGRGGCMTRSRDLNLWVESRMDFDSSVMLCSTRGHRPSVDCGE